jgi:hypothetical protein
MPALQVPCPGCNTTLKAPDTMAGKKARCKKCNTAFRLPGGTGGESVGDSQMLSAMDLPAPAAKTPAARDEVFAATVADDEPLPAAVADDDPLPAAVADEPPPAPAPAVPPPPADAFAFDAARSKPGRRDDDDEDDDRRDRRPSRAGKTGGSGIMLVAVGAAVFALVAGGVVAGTLVYLNSKPPEQAKADKKGDPPPNDPPAVVKNEPKETPKEPKGGGRTATPTPAPAPGPTPPTKGGGKGKAGGAMLALPAGKAVAFPARPAGTRRVVETVDNAVAVAVPFADVRRFFPPEKANADIAVVWVSNKGFQGAGEKLTLTRFSPQSGAEVVKLEVDGDGSPDPACDVSADGKLFAVGNRGTGKLTVWDVMGKKKLIDGHDVYAGKAEHKAAKLAAVYLTEPPDRVVTVTTAGAVHVWEVATAAAAGEFVPPKAAAGKVQPGRGVAPLPNRQGVVVAVGGTVYRVSTAGSVGGGPAAELGGDVGRSLALAASPEGRVVYAFETDADGKKEQAVIGLHDGKKSKAVRLPADAGEPVAAAWCGDATASVATKTGAAVWFDAENDGFTAQVLVRAPDDKAVHAGGDTHWTLFPLPSDPKRCAAVEVAPPPGGIGGEIGGGRPPPATVVVKTEGLFQ